MIAEQYYLNETLHPIWMLCIPFLRHTVENILGLFIERKSSYPTSHEYSWAGMLLNSIRGPSVASIKKIEEKKDIAEYKSLLNKD